MAAEETGRHPYMVALPSDIVVQLAENRDPNGIDRFFYGLVHDVPLDKKGKVYQTIADNPTVALAVNGYLQHAVESGKIEKATHYLMSNYPNFDSHDLEEIVYFSVWRSFFAYPWEEGYNERALNTYLYTSMRWLTREVRHKEHATYEGIGYPRPDTPEDTVLQHISRDELARALVEKTTASGTQLKQLKTEVLRLLSEGNEPKDIADALGVQYARLKGWLRACQRVPIIDRSNRVDVNAGGNWHWSQHTAQVILDDPQVVALLTTRELKLLHHLREGKTYGEVIQEDPSLRVAERGIRYKLHTHGAMSEASLETYKPRRRQLILFLNTIKPVNEEEQAMVEALHAAEGNLYQAARALQMSNGKLLSFLVKRGYYDK